MIRYARNIGRKEAEKHRELLGLEYLNAALQRSKKMPSLKSLINKHKGPPSKASIVDRIKAAAAFNAAKKSSQ